MIFQCFYIRVTLFLNSGHLCLDMEKLHQKRCRCSSQFLPALDWEYHCCYWLQAVFIWPWNAWEIVRGVLLLQIKFNSHDICLVFIILIWYALNSEIYIKKISKKPKSMKTTKRFYSKCNCAVKANWKKKHFTKYFIKI